MWYIDNKKDDIENTKENFTNEPELTYNKNYTSDTVPSDGINLYFDLNNNPSIIRKDENPKLLVDVGYYDSDNKLRFNRVNSLPVNDENNLSYSCKKPTENNPFMNPDLDDYIKYNSPIACNADDNEINDLITKSFDKGLYKNLDDVFNQKNYQRQFLTSPNTSIPNHQTEFAQWLYKGPKTCKEDQTKCLRYDKIKYNKY